MSKFLILIPLLFLLVSGCTSTNGKNISCDFVIGAYESEQVRRDRNNSRDRKHNQDSIDTVNGVLSVIFGSINRAKSSSNKKQDKCT